MSLTYMDLSIEPQLIERIEDNKKKGVENYFNLQKWAVNVCKYACK